MFTIIASIALVAVTGITPHATTFDAPAPIILISPISANGEQGFIG